MKKRCWLSSLTMAALFFVTVTQDLRAADSTAAEAVKPGANHSLHILPNAEFHKLIQDSQHQVLESRKQIQAALDRPDTKAEIQKAGGGWANIGRQLALLSDEEVLALNRQIQSLDLQQETVGGVGGKIMGLILFALSVYLLVRKFS
jgi:hypothetical protein